MLLVPLPVLHAVPGSVDAGIWWMDVCQGECAMTINDVHACVHINTHNMYIHIHIYIYIYGIHTQNHIYIYIYGTHTYIYTHTCVCFRVCAEVDIPRSRILQDAEIHLQARCVEIQRSWLCVERSNCNSHLQWQYALDLAVECFLMFPGNDLN
jgi:hypothetical protein